MKNNNEKIILQKMSNYVKIKKHFATSAFLFNILIPVKVLQSIF